MTEPHLPEPAVPGDDADLEVASAYLDGAATPEEVARVEADPALRRTVERLRTVGDRLAVTAPDPALVDAHVSAALAARAGSADDGTSGTTSITDRAAARDAARRRWVPLGAVAAALLLIALVGGMALVDTDSRSDTVASGADDSSEFSPSDAEASGAGGGVADDAFSDGTAERDLEVRLVFADHDALAAHVAIETGPHGGAPTASAAPSAPAAAGAEEDAVAEAAPCDPIAAADAGEALVLALVPAVVGGRDVTAVVVGDDGDGARRLLVVDEATCVVVDDRPLPDQ